MSVTCSVALPSNELADLHERFTPVHAAVQCGAAPALRRIRNCHDREDLLAEAALVAWRRFLVLVARAAAVDARAVAQHALTVAMRRFYDYELHAG